MAEVIEKGGQERGSTWGTNRTTVIPTNERIKVLCMKCPAPSSITSILRRLSIWRLAQNLTTTFIENRLYARCQFVEGRIDVVQRAVGDRLYTQEAQGGPSPGI